MPAIQVKTMYTAAEPTSDHATAAGMVWVDRRVSSPWRPSKPLNALKASPTPRPSTEKVTAVDLEGGG